MRAPYPGFKEKIKFPALIHADFDLQLFHSIDYTRSNCIFPRL